MDNKTSKSFYDFPKLNFFQQLKQKPKEYEIFDPYIGLENVLYEYLPTNTTKLLEIIQDLIKKNKENPHFFYYVINCLKYYLAIREKHAVQAFHLLSCIILANDIDKQKKIIEFIKEDQKLLCFRYIKKIFVLQGLTPSQVNEEKKKQQNKSLHKRKSLEKIIIEDDIDELKKYINSNPYFSFDVKINHYSSLDVLDIGKNYNNGYLYINPLDLCSYYGSINCFKFLQINNCQFGTNILKFSIAGGNFEIINNVEKYGINFDDCFELSIQYHQNQITEWLISSYRCEIFNLSLCLMYCNYQSFLLLLLNGADINFVIKDGQDTPFTYFCQQKIINVEILKLLINKGADINKLAIMNSKDYYRMSPLMYFCRYHSDKIELIKLLIDNGADVNQMVKCQIGNTYTPLLMCVQSYQDNYNEIIKLLIENGANVNKIHKIFGVNQTILSYLCTDKDPNFQLIQLFLDNGADINMKLYSITILRELCKKTPPNLNLIKLLLQNGAIADKDTLDYINKTNNEDLILLFNTS